MDSASTIWHVVFLVIASQGLLIALLLILKKPGYKWLGGAILAFSLLLCYYLLYWTGLLRNMPPWLGLAMGLPYLIAGFILMQTGELPMKRLLPVLIPFFLYISFFLTALMLPTALNGALAFHAVVQCVIIFGYGVAAYKLSSSQTDRTVSLMFLAFALSHASYYLLQWLNLLTPERDYVVSLVGAAFMYSSAYMVFFGVQKVRKNGSDPISIKMRDKLIDQIESDKLYLDNELRLATLSQATGFSTHQISELINAGGENFADLINRYRVNEAQRLLKTLEGESMSTTQIGYASGFNNKSSFYKHFKKITGMSPMQFRTKESRWIADNE
jgi:AraC-like DNA-binding protein